MNFNTWLARVDKILANRVGMTSEDLIDWHWSEAYEDGLSPSDAVDNYLEENFED